MATDDREARSAATESREERWIDWTSRPYQFVPLNLYDETQKLSEIAVGEMLAEIKRLGDEVERRAAENARLQDGVIQMVNALWLIYEQAQSVARKPSPA